MVLVVIVEQSAAHEALFSGIDWRLGKGVDQSFHLVWGIEVERGLAEAGVMEAVGQASVLDIEESM